MIGSLPIKWEAPCIFSPSQFFRSPVILGLSLIFRRVPYKGAFRAS